MSGVVDAGPELTQVENKDAVLGRCIRRLLDGINTLSRNAQISATGEVAPPRPPDAVTVKVGGELAHIAIDHSGDVNRNIRYFTEISQGDPSFRNPIVIDHGSSRTSHPIPIPTFLDGGNTKVTYYSRSFAQYPGSQPSRPTNGIPFQMNGSSQFTFIQSRGSGTGANTGQQTAVGLGKVQKRRANLGL